MCLAKAKCLAPQCDLLRDAHTKKNQLLQPLTKIFYIIIMARLVSLLRNTLQRDLPESDKLRQALEFLRQNPTEEPTPTARLLNLKNPGTLQRAWYRERKRGAEKRRRGGQNKILHPDQHKALIQYCIDQAINGGKGATKQMMYNCAMYFQKQEKKSIPSWRWFQLWL
jgi:hypothetical protein